MSLWEPPTKQLYPECQSPRVLPFSQSTWRIAAPSGIESRPASRQRIRDTRPKRSGSDPATLPSGTSRDDRPTIATPLLRPAATQLATTALASLHGHLDGPAAHRPAETIMFFIPSRATETTTLFIESSAETARFKVNTNLSVCA
jgi:hypothetical protein